MKKAGILITDNTDSSILFYSTFLNKTDFCECIGEARNESETVEKSSALKPDIILLNIQMEHFDSGIKLIPKIQSVSPKTKIILVIPHMDYSLILKGLSTGASDFFIKNSPLQDLTDKIKRICNARNNKKIYLRTDFFKEVKKIEEQHKSLLYLFSKISTLTQSEVDILYYLCNGLSVAEISNVRSISQSTVRSFISNMLAKLNCKNYKTLVKHINDINLTYLLDNLRSVK